MPDPVSRHMPGGPVGVAAIILVGGLMTAGGARMLSAVVDEPALRHVAHTIAHPERAAPEKTSLGPVSVSEPHP